MRISDWSSDVCSSDLEGLKDRLQSCRRAIRNAGTQVAGAVAVVGEVEPSRPTRLGVFALDLLALLVVVRRWVDDLQDLVAQDAQLFGVAVLTGLHEAFFGFGADMEGHVVEIGRAHV